MKKILGFYLKSLLVAYVLGILTVVLMINFLA